MKIQSLSHQHQRNNFDCGNDEINRYFRENVSQDIRRRQATCYVLTDEHDDIAGFYTLSPFAVRKEELPNASVGRRAYATAYLLGKLAVDKKYRGYGWGSFLLADAVERCLNSDIAATGILVDLKSPDLMPFYLKHKFTPLSDMRAFLYFPKMRF